MCKKVELEGTERSHSIAQEVRRSGHNKYLWRFAAPALAPEEFF